MYQNSCTHAIFQRVEGTRVHKTSLLSKLSFHDKMQRGKMTTISLFLTAVAGQKHSAMIISHRSLLAVGTEQDKSRLSTKPVNPTPL
jgi:hypothetical protein